MAITTVCYNSSENFIYDENLIEINGTCKLKNLDGETPVYSTSCPDIEFKIPLPVLSISSIDFDMNIQGNDEIRFSISKDGHNYYHDGNNWVNSTGYAQTNTAQEIKNNISSLNDSLIVINVKAYLYSHEGTTTPELIKIILTSTIISTTDEDRNSFCDLTEAEKIISVYSPNPEPFLYSEHMEQEKALIKAFQIITRFFYNVNLNDFSTLDIDIRDDFIRAQCLQCANVISPTSCANTLREQGIIQLNADGQKLEIDPDSKYVVCSQARHLMEKYFYDEITIV